MRGPTNRDNILPGVHENGRGRAVIVVTGVGLWGSTSSTQNRRAIWPTGATRMQKVVCPHSESRGASHWEYCSTGLSSETGSTSMCPSKSIELNKDAQLPVVRLVCPPRWIKYSFRNTDIRSINHTAQPSTLLIVR